MSRCVVHGARAAVGGQITRRRETDRETEEEKKAMVRVDAYPTLLTTYLPLRQSIVWRHITPIRSDFKARRHGTLSAARAQWVARSQEGETQREQSDESMLTTCPFAFATVDRMKAYYTQRDNMWFCRGSGHLLIESRHNLCQTIESIQLRACCRTIWISTLSIEVHTVQAGERL